MTALVRTLLILALPFCLIWVVIERLWRETLSAWRLAYFDVRGEVDTFKRAWRSAPDDIARSRGKQ